MDRLIAHMLTFDNKFGAAARSNTPGSMRSLPTILLLLTLLPIILFLLADRTIDIYDGGLSLSMALRYFYGQMPHRDFYFQYGPFHLFAYAALFHAFGVSLLPVRVFEVLIRAATATAGYCLLRRVISQPLSLLGACLLTMLTAYSLPSSGQDAVLAALLCGVVATPVLRAEPTRRRSVLYGISCGCVTLMRYEQGVLLVVLYVLLLLTALFLADVDRQRSFRGSFLSSLWAIAGYMLVALPIFLWLAHANALRDFWYQCFTFARQYYYAARHMPHFPPFHLHQFDQAIVYFPLLSISTAAFTLVTLIKRDKGALRTDRGGVLVFLILLTALYLSKGLVRKDFIQLLPAIATACLLVCVLVVAAPVSWLRRVAMALLLGATVCLGWYFKGLERSAQKQHLLVGQRLFQGIPAQGDQAWCNVASPMTRGFCFTMDADHRAIVMDLIEAGVRPGTKLFAGVPHHDTIYANDNLMYFATGTIPAVKWALFDPDLESRADIQREMVASIDADPPRFVVITSAYLNHIEPNDSSVSSHVFLLDNYLKAHYLPVTTVGVLALYRHV